MTGFLEAAGAKIAWGFVAAPLLPPLAYYLAANDAVTGAVIAGVFSLINTVLLAVLTYRLGQQHGRRVQKNRDDAADSG